jgi:release factor glutamine methyltransferase
MKTVLDCLESGTRYLTKHAVEDARSNMQWLMAHQLECSRTELYMRFDRPLGESELAPLREMLKKRGDGIPLQHILGTVEFLGREFRTDARALIPRPETEELAEALLKLPISRPCRLLDMGTGSGVLGLSLAAALGEECREAVLSDVSEAALELAGENAGLLDLSPTLVQGDLFEPVDGSFDLIVANLPYVPEGERGGLSREVGHDPETALFSGADGLDLLRRFLAEVPPHLAPDGILAMEFGIDQSDTLLELMKSAGLSNPRIESDLSGIARFAFAGPLPSAPVSPHPNGT